MSRYVHLLGVSGSGKTSLANVLNEGIPSEVIWEKVDTKLLTLFDRSPWVHAMALQTNITGNMLIDQGRTSSSRLVITESSPCNISVYTEVMRDFGYLLDSSYEVIIDLLSRTWERDHNPVFISIDCPFEVAKERQLLRNRKGECDDYFDRFWEAISVEYGSMLSELEESDRVYRLSHEVDFVSDGQEEVKRLLCEDVKRILAGKEPIHYIK